MDNQSYELADIDAYLSGKWTEEQALELELAMEQDFILRKEVEAMILVRAGIYYQAREEWKKKMRGRFGKDQIYDSH